MFRNLLLLLLVPVLTACATRVTAPDLVTEPRTVAVLEHGWHTSLMLTKVDHTRVRYAFGDWRWYAEEKEGFWSGVRALALPSRSAFGRQALPPEQPGERLDHVIGTGIAKMHVFAVEAGQVDALVNRLEGLHRSGQASAFDNRTYNLVFVPHPQSYHFFVNSNHMVAQWLRDLGVDVRYTSAIGGWRLKP